MGSIFGLAWHEDIFIIMAAVVAIIIFIVIINFMSKLVSPGNNPYHTYKNSGNKKEQGYKPLIPNPKNELTGKKSISQTQIAPSNVSNNEQNGILKDNSEPTKSSNYGYESLIKEANKKGNPIQKSLNNDGTERIEIDFDSTKESLTPDSILPKYEYLETANNGRFRKLLPTDEKSFFRTWVENGTRLFEFHGNVEKTLANINAIFDDVCEIEGKQNGASQIINEKPGVLDSNLCVEKKAKIKLM